MEKEDAGSFSWDGSASLADEGLHSLEEVEEMKRIFLKQMKKKIDTGEEYKKEIEEDRLADRKNGHFIDEVPPRASRSRRRSQKNHPKHPEEIDTDAEFQNEMEEDRIADCKNGHFVDDMSPRALPTHRTRKKKGSKSSEKKLPSEAAQGSCSSARVSERVASYESALSSRVPDAVSGSCADNERREKAMAAVTPTTFQNLHGDKGSDSFCMVNTEKKGSIPVRRGEREVPTSSIAAKNIHFLDDTKMHDFNVINEAADFRVNALIMDQKQPLSHLICKVNTSNRGAGSMVEGGHVIGGGEGSHNTLPKNCNSLLLPRRKGTDTSLPLVLDVAPITALQHEECAQLDLLEVRPLVDLQSGSLLPCGPATLAAHFPTEA